MAKSQENGATISLGLKGYVLYPSYPYAPCHLLRGFVRISERDRNPKNDLYIEDARRVGLKR